MTSQTLEQKINYSINDVKNAMNTILANFKTTFIDQQVNDVFNTYQFGKIKCMYNVALEAVDENTTNVKIVCSDRSSENSNGYQALAASIQSYITEFVNILTAQLQGKTQEEMQEVVKQNSSDENTGCIFGGISLILAGVMFYYIIKLLAM